MTRRGAQKLLKQAGLVLMIAVAGALMIALADPDSQSQLLSWLFLALILLANAAFWTIVYLARKLRSPDWPPSN